MIFRHIRQIRNSVHRMERIAASRAREEILGRPAYRDGGRLAAAGFQAYSQADEDGILAEIFRRIGPGGRTFVEIGAGWLQNNTLYLLLQGWRGACASSTPSSTGGTSRTSSRRWRPARRSTC